MSSQADDRPVAIRCNFEDGYQPVDVKGEHSVIQGEVPKPFADDSSWAGLKLQYSRDTERAFEGKSALRMTVSDIVKGWAQLALSGVPLDKEHFVKVSIAMLAPTVMKTNLVLRKKSYPWTTYWEQSFDVSPEWKTYEMLLPPMIDDPDAMITLITKTEGSLVIDDFRLEYLTEAEAGKQSARKEGNLAPASSFPLGLAGQWCVTHGEVGLCRAQASPEVRGPTGAPALEFGIGGDAAPYRNMNSALKSPVFELNGGRVHGIGFYARGSEPGQTLQVVLADPNFGRNAFTQIVTLGTDWQWVALSAKIPYSIRGFYTLGFGAGKRCWIDGVTVVEGEEPVTFRRNAEAEVALVPKQLQGVSFPDEAAEYEYFLYGNLKKGWRLTARLIDPYGSVVALDPVDVQEGSEQRGAGVIGREKLAKLGSYQLELVVEDAGGRAVSRPQEILLHRLRRPKMADRDAPDSPFGTHINPVLNEARTAKALGFNWVRLHDGGQHVTGWSFLEKEPGKFDFSASEKAVDLLRSEHLMILGMLNTTPRFYTDCPKDYPSTGHTPHYFVVKDEFRSKWQEYCRQLVGRYRGKIDYWEVMNEPYASLSFFIKKAEKVPGGKDYKMTAGTPENYVRLLGDAWTAAKEASPDARLLWMMNHDAGWNDRCLKAGALDYTDILSYHYYLLGNALKNYPDSQVGRIFSRRFQEDLAGNDRPLTFWNTEGSLANLQVPWKNSPAYDPAGCERMSNALVRSYVAFLAAGNKKWFVYTAHAWGTWAPFYYSYIAPDGSLAPSASALSAFMGLLEGKTFRQAVPLGDGVWAFIFGDDAESLAVLASNRSTAQKLVDVPTGWKMLDTYGNLPDRGGAEISDRCVVYLTKAEKADAAVKSLASLKLVEADK